MNRDDIRILNLESDKLSNKKQQKLIMSQQAIVIIITISTSYVTNVMTEGNSISSLFVKIGCLHYPLI